MVQIVTRKRCKFCQSEDRDDLEAALESGQLTPDDVDIQNDWPSGTASRHQRNHMGEYFDDSNPRCKLCTDPNRSLYEQGIDSGKLKPVDLATVLNISEAQVKRHMTKHLKPLVQKSAATMIAKKDIDEIAVLSRNIERLEEKVDELFAETELDAPYIDSLTKLAKEIRESLKYLMEFKGKLIHKRQDTIIVAQMQIVQEVLAQNHPQVWLDVKSKMEERLQ